jgi:hypothetical protein
LRHTKVVIGIFKRLGNGLVFLVKGNPAQLGICRDAIIIRVHGTGLKWYMLV